MWWRCRLRSVSGSSIASFLTWKHVSFYGSFHSADTEGLSVSSGPACRRGSHVPARKGRPPPREMMELVAALPLAPIVFFLRLPLESIWNASCFREGGEALALFSTRWPAACPNKRFIEESVASHGTEMPPFSWIKLWRKEACLFLAQ